MKGSTIYTIILIAFLVVCVGYFVFQESKPKSAKQESNPNVTTGSIVKSPDSSTTNTNVSPAGVSSDKIIVYYFHGNKRCTNCIKIENYSKEAVDTGFASELQKGDIEWRMLNTDKPENEHFVKDYQLTTKSVVVVKMRDGSQLKYKVLSKVWNYLNDKTTFVNYVQEEIRTYLNEDKG